MCSFVLVHGAWQHAGTWDLIVPRIEALGYPVVAPKLTGLGPDPDALDGGVGLDTHVEDVVRVFDEEDLDDVVLVGHSYAGMVITGAAERTASRIRRLVYIDAFIPGHGESALHLMPERLRLVFREQAEANGGWRLPAGPRQLDLWGLEPGEARDFVEQRLCDFSIRCFEQPLFAPTAAARDLDRSYIACVKEEYPARVAFEPFAATAKKDGWLQAELPTGHDCHVEQPDEVAELLVNAKPGAPSSTLRSRG